MVQNLLGILPLLLSAPPPLVCALSLSFSLSLSQNKINKHKIIFKKLKKKEETQNKAGVGYNPTSRGDHQAEE